MKTLDVQALHNAIDQTLEQLKQQSDEIAKVKKAVEGITSLDDALKGKGGDAIRSFYEECHTPFLKFFESFIEEYQSALKKMKKELQSLEPNHNGFISQAFLEHELEQGLNAADRTTKNLVSKANATIAKVSHIVDLPDLNDNDFHEQNRKAMKDINQTIEKLHTFDREQTNALKTAENDLETMQKYIARLEKMYTGPKIEITGYQKGSILKAEENANINGPVGGFQGELENAEPSPMEIMLNKLSDQEDPEVDSLAKADHSKKIDTGIRVINGKVYNMKGYKKLGFVDVTDEIGTGKSFVGGSYTLYSNGQIVRKYISGGEVKYELVRRIPENRVKKSDIEKALDWAKDTVGELSGGYDGYRAITGVDPVTGEKLSVTDRILSGVSVIPATKVVKVGKYVFKANKGAKTVKKVSTVEKGTKGTNKSLLPNEGKAGTYEELIDAGTRGDNITPHHMPSAKYMKSNEGIHKNDGVSMNMEHPHPGKGGRHRQTETYGMTGRKLEEYINLPPRNALARDIWDARNIYKHDGLYTSEIRSGLKEVIDLNRNMYPEIFKKGR
ncbi:T7SS effector LXG polymorphic toxin [Bacillus paralicheniformis]|uniref:T7SS effector LXG polymorphic toxin n=1 Tax=Bacillus paralicheniformis TaxID=1648923 RepID=UPI003D23CA55